MVINLAGKRRSKALERLEKPKVERVEVLGSYIPKNDDFQVPVYTWDRGDWGDKGVKVYEALGFLRMGF